MLIICRGESNYLSMLSPCFLRLTGIASSAAWHGTRIILRQTSPESVGIFDFIMELYAFCSGHWRSFSTLHNVDPGELEAFLEYASTFLSNIGNYYVFLLTYDDNLESGLPTIGFWESKDHS
jgi:hypothetical protein